VVSDPRGFEAALLADICTDTEGFFKLIDAIRTYRDKFIAHLDDELRMHLPVVAAGARAITFYHRHVVELETAPSDRMGLMTAAEFELCYDKFEEEAAKIYRTALNRPR
jgi:hypothetical protein